MDLKRIASYFDTQPFDVYDSVSGTWSIEAFYGQLKAADDFVSLFNRATRRRMLFVSPDQFVGIGQGSVIRISGGGEPLILGHPQEDAAFGEVYRYTIPCNYASRFGTIKRRKPAGPANDPGPLVETVIGTSYFDVELRTVEKSGDDLTFSVGKYFLYLPYGVSIEEGDTIEVSPTEYYRIVEIYEDSGLLAARATTAEDLRQDFTYKRVNGSGTFDNNLGRYVENVTTYTVAGEVIDITSTDSTLSVASKPKYKILIPMDNIGFMPNVGDKITLDGQDRNVISVTRDRLNHSWDVVCL